MHLMYGLVMQALGCRDQVLHCSPWHDLLKWTWHPVTGQLKAALSSKSFDKAYDSREGFFFTRSAQFSGGACFNLEQKDWWVPFREMALLNCLSLCRSAIPQQWVSGNCSQSSYEPDNQSNSWQCCAGALWDGHCSVMNCLNFIPVTDVLPGQLRWREFPARDCSLEAFRGTSYFRRQL